MREESRAPGSQGARKRFAKTRHEAYRHELSGRNNDAERVVRSVLAMALRRVTI